MKRRLAWLMVNLPKTQSMQLPRGSALSQLNCTDQELDLAAARLEKAGGLIRLPESGVDWSVLEPTRDSIEVLAKLQETTSIMSEITEFLEKAEPGTLGRDAILNAFPELENSEILKALEALKKAGFIDGNKSESRLRLRQRSPGELVGSADLDPNGFETKATIERGAIIDGYRLLEPIGRGGSAEVWKAQVARRISGVELLPDTIVAMKFYSTAILAQIGEHIRIQREFLVANRIDHENVVKVFDLVVSPNRNSFLVMEFVDGNVLSRVVPGYGLPFQEVVSYGIQLARALSALHTMGALHRDIKPSNMIVKDGALKLLDLGIVAVEDGHDATAPSYFLGSKHYASFEQLLGEPNRPVDERSDVYSLGASLFHLYSGRQPYAGRNANHISVSMERGDYDILAPKVDATELESQFVEYVNGTLMAKEPAKRPAKAAEVVNALNSLQGMINMA